MIHNRNRNRWYLRSVFLLFGCLFFPLFYPTILHADKTKAFPDTKAISKIANLAGNKTLVDEYRIKTERIKAAVQKNLWDKKDEFFKTGCREKL